MLISVVMIHHWDFHKMGIDMSHAFDAMNKEKILDVLKSVGYETDDASSCTNKITVHLKSSYDGSQIAQRTSRQFLCAQIDHQPLDHSLLTELTTQTHDSGQVNA